MHWSSRWIGRQYVEGRFECADLAIDVAASVLGKTIILPAKLGHERIIEQQISSEVKNYAERISSPIDAHPVLIQVENSNSHIGVAAHISGRWYVLHCTERIGVMLELFTRINASNHRSIEGFYRWL